MTRGVTGCGGKGVTDCSSMTRRNILTSLSWHTCCIHVACGRHVAYLWQVIPNVRLMRTDRHESWCKASW